MDKFTFIGIDITRKPPHFSYIAVDEDLSPLAIQQCSLPDLLSYLAGIQNARVSINAPLHLNCGLLAHSARKKQNPGRWPNIREIEYAISSISVEIYHTPDTANRNDPMIYYGVYLATLLTEMGYALLDHSSSPRQFFETPASTAFWSLHEPLLMPEESFMGRVQRQLIAYDLDLPVADAMDFFEELTRFRVKNGNVPLGMILPIHELNAWITAYTAWVSWKQPDQLAALGDETEGKIYLPALPKKLHQYDGASQGSLF